MKLTPRLSEERDELTFNASHNGDIPESSIWTQKHESMELKETLWIIILQVSIQ